MTQMASTPSQTEANIKRYGDVYRQCELTAAEIAGHPDVRKEITLILFNRFFDDQIKMLKLEQGDRHKEKDAGMLENLIQQIGNRI